MKTALSIAGSDPSGGAGIQADLKTFAAHGVYGMAAISALTAQNTVAVFAVEAASDAMLRAQLESVFSDIFPDAVKVGMLPSARSVETVARELSSRKARNVVVDTVMVSSSGTRLLDGGAERTLMGALFPLARVVTPNVPEAEALTGVEIRDRGGMIEAARALSRLTDAAILLKGGHVSGDASDLLLLDGSPEWFVSTRIASRHTHGTGCALSSAIAANLALGYPVREAVSRAKDYVWRAIRDAPGLGRGNGPLSHGSAT